MSTDKPTWTFPKWVDMADVAAPAPKPQRACQCVLTQDAIAGGDIHFHVCAACDVARRLAALEAQRPLDELDKFMAKLARESDAYMEQMEYHFYVDCPGCHFCVPVPLARCETCGDYGSHDLLCGIRRVQV